MRNKIKDKERRKLRQENGYCIQCGKNKLYSKSYCKQHLFFRRKESKKIRDKNLQNNLCRYCGNSPLQKRKVCKIHWLYHKSSKHLGTSKYWKNLLEIFENQKRICPYSGESLILGINADIDHIIPKYLGGKSDIENIQWVYSKINRLKSYFSEKEFLTLIEKVYKFKCSPLS